MRSATFGPTPGVRADRRLVAQRDGVGQIRRRQCPEHRQRHLGADALHRLQQPEPFALDIAAEAEQLDLVLADIGLDRKHRGLARRRQRLQRSRRTMHLIADAADIEDDVVLAVAVDQAFQFADHACNHLQPQHCALAVMGVGNRDRQRVGGVWRFRLGLWQQYLQHHQYLVLVGMAGADHRLLHLVRRIFSNRYPEHRGREHRNPPRLTELQRGHAVLVDEGLLDRGFRRIEIAEHGGKPLVNRQQPGGERQAIGRLHRAAADENQPVALDLDDAPAGAAQARIDAQDSDRVANRS